MERKILKIGFRAHEKITTGLGSGFINSAGIARRPNTKSIRPSRFFTQLRLQSPNAASIFSRARSTTLCVFFATLVVVPGKVSAADCGDGVGTSCTISRDCEENSRATVCVNGACAIPCATDANESKLTDCAMGEVCVEASEWNSSSQTHVCKSVPMTMDLNLLDTCIYHFVKGAEDIDLSGSKLCSSSQMLTRLLDRDGDGLFNIFDLDACIADFINVYKIPCDKDLESCPNGQIYCDEDADCGGGAYCDDDLYFCRRECGFFVNRGEPLTEPQILDRPCHGWLKTCDYSRGRCKEIDLGMCPEDNPDCLACQINGECPNGSYCFTGKCTPKCMNSLDCPDSNWYCSNTNTCLPRPAEFGDNTKSFDPKNYSILMSDREVEFTVNKKSVEIPILIMDLKERKPVFDSPNVVFGYRMETKYARKQEPICLGDLSGLPVTVRNDCRITSDREFVTMENPFGIIYGDGDPRFRISLNLGAFEKLTPGLYESELTAIFNNGDMDTIKVRVRKPTPSGKYFGKLSVYLDKEKNTIGQGNVAADLYVAEDEPMVEWDELLRSNNLLEKKPYEDKTLGYWVRGNIKGNLGMIFDLPSAGTPAENEIPVKGIYSPDLGRMRLIAVIDLPKEYCAAEDNQCGDRSSQLRVVNRFGRRIQRIIQFDGPFLPLEGEYKGQYRETISGLLPWNVTLSGDFRLSQMIQDSTPVEKMPTLRGDSLAVGFPADIEDRIERDKNKYCPEIEKGHFASENAFLRYLDSDDWSKDKVFSNLTTMRGEIEKAIGTLEGNPDAYLSVNEFLKGNILFCEDGNTESCINRDALRCGLALYRRAFIAEDWIDPGDLDTSEMHTLFCDGETATSTGCLATPKQDPVLAVLHEHNRFYEQLVQTYAYEAGNDTSDAFYTLYKGASGKKFVSSTCDYKIDKLSNAVANYDAMRSVVYSPESTVAMTAWPMKAFSGMGNDWIDYLSTVSRDRMKIILELLDLKRRVANSLDSRVEAFASHLLHDEYLVQVLLVALQDYWQGSQMKYQGSGPEMMAEGDLVLAKVGETRNPLGLHDHRVFFENSDVNLSNWQNYRKRVLETKQLLDNATNAAIENMRNALADEVSLNNSLQTASFDAERQIDDLCGPDDSYTVPECEVTEEERKTQEQCVMGEPDCFTSWTCDNRGAGDARDCENPVKMLNGKITDSGEHVCRVDTVKYDIDFQGGKRSCVRGRMGALIQERVALKIQRESALRRFEVLKRQIARQQQYISETMSSNDDLVTEMKLQAKGMTDILQAITNANVAMGAADATLEGLKAGDAKLIGVVSGAATAWGIAKAAHEGAVGEAKIAMQKIEDKAAKTKQEYQNDREVLLLRKELDGLLDQVSLLLLDYDAAVQQIVNISLQMDDTLYLARQASRRYKEVVTDYVDNLIGRESGDVLLRNTLVVDANQLFSETLVETYKMARAFVYRYNKGDDYQNYVNQVYRLQTSKDIADYIKKLNKAERDYCGGTSGLDCDYENNTKLFRISLRDYLAPTLRDITDAKTGGVLTKGQQFHNLITSSNQFVKRYKRGSGVRTQIVLPFTIWMQNQGSDARPRYMVNPEECNQIIVGKRNPNDSKVAGSIGVNIMGTRIDGELIQYEIKRGNTDYLRSCIEYEKQNEPKVNVYTVGYAAQNEYGKMDVPPDFITQSQAFPACINNWRLEDPTERKTEDQCFNLFARDRSLGAPDWEIIIPAIDVSKEEIDGGQKWLLGDGLSDDKKPIIEDIVIYFRYNSQPINRE